MIVEVETPEIHDEERVIEVPREHIRETTKQIPIEVPVIREITKLNIEEKKIPVPVKIPKYEFRINKVSEKIDVPVIVEHPRINRKTDAVENHHEEHEQ